MPSVSVGQEPIAQNESTPWVNNRVLAAKIKEGVDSCWIK
jgi:hypothetical protein